MSNKSAEAFLHQVESGKRITDAHRIHSYISASMDYGGATYQQVTDDLRLHHGTSTARLSELCDLGVIYEDDNGYFHITPSDKIGEYAARREDARYKKWRKLGEKNGWFNQLRIV